MFRQVKTNSSLVWWSSSPSNFLDTIKFDEKTMTLTAFQHKALVVGNPEMTMVFTYCQVSPSVLFCKFNNFMTNNMKMISYIKQQTWPKIFQVGHNAIQKLTAQFWLLNVVLYSFQSEHHKNHDKSNFLNYMLRNEHERV